MSNGWFSVDINSLQSSIMDSVGEASKLMDELNLDNMQDESKTSKEKVGYAREEDNLESNTVLNEEARQVSPFISPFDSNDDINRSQPEEEVEEVVEFTEFGVPIRVLQSKSSALKPDIDLSDTELPEDKTTYSDTGHSGFSIWNLDTLQEENHDGKHSSLAQVDFSEVDVAQYSSPRTIQPTSASDMSNEYSEHMNKSDSLPQYINHSLISDYLYPNPNNINLSSEEETKAFSESYEISDVEATANEDESLFTNADSKNIILESVDDKLPEAKSFFSSAASSILLNAKANIPESMFAKPSFFDDDDDDDDVEVDGDGKVTSFKQNDPIYRRVEQNRINPPKLSGSSQQSMFQSGSAFFAVSSPVSNEITPAEVRRKSRAYGIVSRGITCLMWLLRLVWNIVITLSGMIVGVVRSMFDCPASAASSSPLSASDSFCEAIQHPVSRARIVAEYRTFVFNTIVSNNFIAVMTTLLLAASYWKFRRYGTDSGD